MNGSPGKDGSDGLLPGQPGFDRAVAQGAFDFAKTRFVRSINSEGMARVLEQATRRRAKLRADIDSLRTLVRARHETAVEHARAYGAILPHRVGKTWIQPPAQFEKVGASYGVDRFYKRAAKAAKEYVEARDLLIKRRDELVQMELELRRALDEREAALLRQVESGAGLQAALRRDPLLHAAYQKLQALKTDLDDHPVAGLGDLI